MSPREIRDVAASAKQRLLNLARERGEDFNFLPTRYGVERLLYRLDRSKHAEEFVLKGAMLFHMGPDPLPHRATRDVDLLGKGPPEPARLVEEQEYEGVRMQLQARMGSARVPVQVDVGFGDALTPPPKRQPQAVLLDFPAPRLLTCPWETVIAEKFEALVDLGMANSRMKDLFDLTYLSATLALDGAVLGKLRDFLMPPVEALVQEWPFKKKWSPGGPWREIECGNPSP